MARSLGTLTLDIVAKLGGFTQGMDQAQRVAADRARRIERTFGRLRNSIVGVFAFIGGAGLVRSIVSATSEAERSLALLDNAVRASGGAAGYTTAQLADMASELQKVTTFGDDAVMSAQQLLLRFQSIQGLNFERALKSATDLATVLGTDLNSASLLVGKALESPIKGMTQLERSGVVFSQSQREVIKRLVETGRTADAQRTILDGLESRFQGAAVAARDTFGGALEGLKNAFGDLLEAKGGLPDAVSNINQLSDLLSDPQFVANVNTLTSAIITGFGGAAKAIADVTGTARYLAEEVASRVYGPAADDIVRLSDAIVRLNEDAKRVRDEGAVATFFRGGEGVRQNVLAGIEKEIEANQRLLDAAMAANIAVAGGDPASTGGGSSVAPLSEEFQKREEQLLRQIALYGKTGEAAKLAYEIQSGALDELSRAEQKRLLALAYQYDALGESIELIYTEQEKLSLILQESSAEIRGEINNYLKEFGADYDEVTQILVDATDDVVKDMEKSFGELNEFMLEAARGTQNVLADTLFGAMEGEIGNVEDAFVSMINRLVAESLAAKLATKLFGDPEKGGGGLLDSLGGFLGGIFGGGRANGGGVSAGHLYRVNERGVEALRIPGREDYLLTGGASGEVIPNNRIGRGGNVSQTVNFYGRADARSVSQLAIETARRQRIASARLG